MEISVSYEEVTRYLNNKYKQQLYFKYIDEKTLGIIYKSHSYLPEFTINMRLEELCNDMIYMSYECGFAMSLLSFGFIKLLRQMIPDFIEVDENNKKIKVFLQRIKGLKKSLKIISLVRIIFNERGIKVSLNIK